MPETGFLTQAPTRKRLGHPARSCAVFARSSRSAVSVMALTVDAVRHRCGTAIHLLRLLSGVELSSPSRGTEA